MAEDSLGIVPVRRALLSVSDKKDLAGLAAALTSMNVELLSTGGTAKAIRDAGHPVRDVAEVTGFPECLDGRVKTLHPKIHAGLLAIRSNREHMETIRALGIVPIDLLVVNLYPFEETIRGESVDEEKANENIDIGGPAMIRGAAKNHADVAVVTNVLQYKPLLEELLDHGGTTRRFRQTLKADAFAMTARYDTAIARYFSGLYRVSNM